MGINKDRKYFNIFIWQRLRKDKRDENSTYPVYGSNGIIGHHSSYLVKENCLIIGRKGSIGQVHISYIPCWPIDTTYYIIPSLDLNLRYLYYLIKSLNLEDLDKSTTIPGLNRNDIYSREIPFPPKIEQIKIVEEINRNYSYSKLLLKIVKKNLKKSNILRKSILKSAFEGKLISQENLMNKLIKSEINTNDFKIDKKKTKQKSV